MIPSQQRIESGDAALKVIVILALLVRLKLGVTPQVIRQTVLTLQAGLNMSSHRARKRSANNHLVPLQLQLQLQLQPQCLQSCVQLKR